MAEPRTAPVWIAKVVAGLFAAAFFGASLYLLALNGPRYLKHARAQSWPSTDAVIEQVEVTDHGRQRLGCIRPSTRFGPAGSGSCGGWTHPWSVAVSYRYSVDGRNYSGQRFTLEESRQYYNSEELARAYATNHPKGSNVRASYDPDAPTRSVLVVEVPNPANLWAAGALAGLGCALLIGMRFVRS